MLASVHIAVDAVHHVRLTEADRGAGGRYGFLLGGVIHHLGAALPGLRPVAAAGDRFDQDRTGLDHLSLRVADRSALHAAAAHLDDLGVAHEGVKDLGRAALLGFRDPDGTALEPYATGPA